MPPGSRLLGLMQEPRGKTQGSVRRQRPPSGSSPMATTYSNSGGRNNGGDGGSGGDGDIKRRVPAGVAPEGRSAEGLGGGSIVAPSASASSSESPSAVKRSGGVGGGTSSAEGGGAAARGTRRWGYRRGPREQLRRNLFGRFAPIFFYPLAQVCVCVFSAPLLMLLLSLCMHFFVLFSTFIVRPGGGGLGR